MSDTISWSYHAYTYSRTCWINDQCRSISINYRSNFWNWSKIQLNKGQWWPMEIKEALTGIEKHWSAFRSIEKYWSILIVIDRHWYLLIDIAINTSNLIQHWLVLIDIDHWYSMSWYSTYAIWSQKLEPYDGLDVIVNFLWGKNIFSHTKDIYKILSNFIFHVWVSFEMCDVHFWDAQCSFVLISWCTWQICMHVMKPPLWSKMVTPAERGTPGVWKGTQWEWTH